MIKQLIITALIALYVTTAIAITLSSPTIGANHSSIPEYIDNQSVKYQMFTTKAAYPSNYLLIWTADWCVKCPQMVAIGKKLEEEGFNVFYLNMMANKKKAREDKIALLPTAIIYTNDEEVKRIIGFDPEADIEAQIRKVLKKNKDEPNDYDIY